MAVVISYEEYERLEEIDDAYWSARAEESKKEGFLSTQESETFLNELAHAKN